MLPLTHFYKTGWQVVRKADLVVKLAARSENMRREWIPVLVSTLWARPAGSTGPSVAAGPGVAWPRQPAPPSGPAGGSGPPESLVWAGPPGPAAPRRAARDSARSAGCFPPAHTEKKDVVPNVKKMEQWSEEGLSLLGVRLYYKDA